MPPFFFHAADLTQIVASLPWRLLPGLPGIKRRMVLPRFLAALVLSSALVAPAWGQDGGDSIVVTGQAERPSSDVVAAQARAITRADPALRDVPLAQMQDRLCPGVIGMTVDGAAPIIDRIRATARDLGIPLADDAQCHANLVLMIVADGAQELAALHRSSPQLFETLTVPDRRDLLDGPGPAHAWHITSMRSRDGFRIPQAESLDRPPATTMWSAHSKIYLAVRQDIDASFVLLDSAAVKGKTLVQLADYATMRGLARTRPPAGDAAGLDTILSLFANDGPPPQGLTAFDRAYLTSLYSSPANLPGMQKLLGVSHQLRRGEAGD